MPFVRGPHVTGAEPLHVARNSVARREFLRPELERHRRYTFLLHPSAVFVDRVESRYHERGTPKLSVRERDPGRVGVLGRVGRWHRPQELPPFGHACARLACQQRVHDRRARAGCTGDEDRFADLFVAHAGVSAHVRDRLCPHLEEAQQEAPGYPATEQAELGFVSERRQQDGERLEEAVVSETVGAAPVDAERGSGFGEQVIAAQGQAGLVGDRQHVTGVHRLHPFGPRGWPPGHELLSRIRCGSRT